MIDCREAVGRMWAYLSQGLEAHGKEELEQHLGVCLRCCGELEFSRQLREKAADAGVERMPQRVRSRIDHLLQGGKGPPADQA